MRARATVAPRSLKFSTTVMPASRKRTRAFLPRKPPEPVKAAAVIQVLRHVERGFQGFGDARANPDVGQMFFFKQIDPEAAAKLAPYRMMEIP